LRINEESKRWVELGIIDDSARENIIALYQKKRSLNPVFVIFAILGSLLLSLGVILIFATNWENIPRNIKLLIAFFPLVAAMCAFLFTTIKRRDSAAFRESTALALCLSIFATIALIGQVYHIPSDIESYIRLCMFLSLPAIYFHDAKAAAALFIACAVFSGAGAPGWIALLSMTAIAPFLIWQIKKSDQAVILRYLSLLAGASAAFLLFKLPYGWSDTSVTLLACAVLLLAIEAFVGRVKDIGANKILTTISCLMIVSVLALSSFRDVSRYSFYETPQSLVVILCAVLLYAAARFYKRRFELNMIDAVVLCAMLGSPLFWLWSNVLLAALGVFFIVTGVGKNNLKTLNIGMFLIVFVIVARFFDSGLGLLERGVAFVVIGAGFFLTNLLLYRKWRAK